MNCLIMTALSVLSLLAVILHQNNKSIKIASSTTTETPNIIKKKIVWKSDTSYDKTEYLHSRSINVRLKSNWDDEDDDTCQRYGYFLDRNDHWKYLDAIQKDEDAVLEYSISLKAYSPLCELHNGLVDELGIDRSRLKKDVIGVLYPQKITVLNDIDSLLYGKSTMDCNITDFMLPGESTHPSCTQTNQLVVVYVPSLKPYLWYTKLKESNIPFIVRFYKPSAEKMSLQGFGVRLDIRNIEYRAFDDAPSSTTSFNTFQIPHDHNIFLSGVNVHILSQRYENHNLEELVERLYKQHKGIMTKMSVIPHAYQRRRLSFQTTSIILNEYDPLHALQHLSQNLPSYANLLSMTSTSFTPELLTWSKIMNNAIAALNPSYLPFAFYINGLRIPIERPSFNVFELLKTIKSEMSLMDHMMHYFRGDGLDLQGLLADASNLFSNDSQEDDDGTAGASALLRIDVGRTTPYKQPILYINNIERDVEYNQYSYTLQSLLFGQIQVRRNLFHALLIINPFNSTKEEINALDMLYSLMYMQGFPIRVGFLFVDNNGSLQPYDMIHLFTLLGDYYASPSILSTIKYWLNHDKHIQMTKQQVWNILSQHLEEEQQKKHISLKKLYELWLDEDEDYQTNYNENTLPFIKSKSLKPGTIFFNGVPISLSSSLEDSVNTIVQNDIRFIATSFMSGAINDMKPKSIYSFLLTKRAGMTLYSSYHPLLTEVALKDKIYIHPTSAMPLHVVRDEIITSYFGIALYIDYNQLDHVEMAQQFIELIKEYKVEKAWIGSTIVPISTLSGLNSIMASIMNQQHDVNHFTDLLSYIHQYLKEPKDDFVEFLTQLKSENVTYWIDILSNQEPCKEYDYSYISSSPLLAVNGRVYPITSSSIEVNDIQMLTTLETKRSMLVSALIKSNDKAKLVWKISSYFSQLLGSKYGTIDIAQKDKKRINVIKVIESSIDKSKEDAVNDNPLLLKWNTEDGSKPQIIVVLDPLTEPTQRIAPILLTIRDYFKLPFYLYFAPRLELNSEDVLPISSYYRFVAQHPIRSDPKASFMNLPTNHVFTIQMDVPEPWDVQQSNASQDTDNLRCVSLETFNTFCGDYAHGVSQSLDDIVIDQTKLDGDGTIVEYTLKGLLFFGQCYDMKSSTIMDPPNGLQLTLSKMQSSVQDIEILPDGSSPVIKQTIKHYSDTLVMKTLGYWQVHANPGIWELNIAKNTKGAEMYNILSTEEYDNGSKSFSELADSTATVPFKTLVMKDFVHKPEILLVKRRAEYSKGADNVLLGDSSNPVESNDDVIHVFSLATGHLYERLLKIMMLSVTKRTSSKVKFWLFENYLSPSFKSSAKYMAAKIGCDVEFVTYKWPEWLRGQTEKQRVIWGYKILFLDVLFPLSVKKIIYVDADQVVRGDLKELWDYDLKGAPYGYVPFCTSRESTLGYQFWRTGFWKSHLRNKPYHISALYVVDLHLFRRKLVGDKLRQTYQQLSADPNSLANLDQDLPNFAQHEVPIHSLPQEWLWCETWCSDETKAQAKTIDLCNNPDHKENKVSMAKRIISGELFKESWTELDAEVEQYYKEYVLSLTN